MGVEMSEFASKSYAATAFVPIANAGDSHHPPGYSSIANAAGGQG
jgi:hypothetical protein